MLSLLLLISLFYFSTKRYQNTGHSTTNPRKMLKDFVVSVVVVILLFSVQIKILNMLLRFLKRMAASKPTF